MSCRIHASKLLNTCLQRVREASSPLYGESMVMIAPFRLSEVGAASELIRGNQHSELHGCVASFVESYITEAYPWSAFGAWHSNALIGIVLCTESYSRITIDLLLVDKAYRREGVASMLVDRLVARFNSHRKICIDAAIPEANLIAQQFFRHKGFLCVHQDGSKYLMRLTRRGAIRASKGIKP